MALHDGLRTAVRGLPDGIASIVGGNLPDFMSVGVVFHYPVSLTQSSAHPVAWSGVVRNTKSCQTTGACQTGTMEFRSRGGGLGGGVVMGIWEVILSQNYKYIMQRAKRVATWGNARGMRGSSGSSDNSQIVPTLGLDRKAFDGLEPSQKASIISTVQGAGGQVVLFDGLAQDAKDTQAGHQGSALGVQILECFIRLADPGVASKALPLAEASLSGEVIKDRSLVLRAMRTLKTKEFLARNGSGHYIEDWQPLLDCLYSTGSPPTSERGQTAFALLALLAMPKFQICYDAGDFTNSWLVELGMNDGGLGRYVYSHWADAPERLTGEGELFGVPTYDRSLTYLADEDVRLLLDHGSKALSSNTVERERASWVLARLESMAREAASSGLRFCCDVPC